MSALQQDILQKVMDIFMAAGVTSDNPNLDGETPWTSFRDYQPRDMGTDGQLPFVQAFASVVTTEVGGFGQRVSTLSFSMEAYRFQDGPQTVMSQTIERFGSAIRRDPTLGGLVLRCNVASRALDVVNPDSEIERAAFTITAEYDDGDINQLTEGAPFRRSKIDLLPVDGRASDISLGTNVVAEDSTVIPGAIEFTTSAPQNSPFWSWDSNGFSEFPLDVTVPALRVWRALIYMQPGTSETAISFSMRFGSVAGSNTDSVSYTQLQHTGWNEFVVDLDTPPNLSNGTFDETAMLTLQFSFFAFGMEMDGVQVKRIFQYPRDRGNSGLSLGF